MREPGHNGRYRGGRVEESGALDNGFAPSKRLKSGIAPIRFGLILFR
jgi:hypothetical protein